MKTTFTALPVSFYARATAVVARDAIGKLLVRRRGARVVVARIVETEAYLGPQDRASHARAGATRRAAIMFGPPGHLYVYLVYGMHHCMNLVTETDGIAGAVLVRAAEPLSPPPPQGERGGVRGVSLSGPGRLCASLDITRALDGLDLTSGDALYLASDNTRAPRIATSRRIGVDYAGPWATRRLRFYVPENPNVSGRPR